jgi:hypothetical protein
LLSIAIDLNKKNVIFSKSERKTIYSTEGLSRLVFMDMKLEHGSIISKKISSFVQALTEIFNFYFGFVTYGPPCILFNIEKQ